MLLNDLNRSCGRWAPQPSRCTVASGTISSVPIVQSLIFPFDKARALKKVKRVKEKPQYPFVESRATQQQTIEKKDGVQKHKREKVGEKERESERSMAVSVSIVAIVTSLHLIAFVLAVGAERRRSTVYTRLCIYI